MMLEPLQLLRSEQIAETESYRRAWRLIDVIEWLVHTRQHIVSVWRVVGTDRTSFPGTGGFPPAHRYLSG